MGKKKNKTIIHNKSNDTEDSMENVPVKKSSVELNSNKENIKESLNNEDKTKKLIDEGNSENKIEETKFQVKEEMYIASKEDKVESYADKSMREFLTEEQRKKKEKKLKIIGFILGLCIISLALYLFSPYKLNDFKSDVNDAFSLKMKSTDMFAPESDKNTKSEDKTVSK